MNPLQPALEELRRLNPLEADKFKYGSAGMSILYQVDKRKAAIICSMDIDGNMTHCRTKEGYPVISRKV